MKCVVVTRMKNEIDIAEAFIRHHAAFVAHIIVIDDYSSDGTFELMQTLKAEGLPLDLHRETQVGNTQSDTTTRLMHRAFDVFGADWVVPLDADEFLEVARDADLSTLLPTDGRYLVEMRWDNFVWMDHEPTLDDQNPVVSMRLRMPTRRWHYKVMIPRAIGSRIEAMVLEGNHAVVLSSTPCDTLFLDQIRLCHFPIRSIEQYSYKMVFGYLRYCRGDDEQAGFHYRQPFHLLKTDMAAFVAQMELTSRNYSLAPGESNEGEPQVMPLRYRGGPLRYSSGRSSNAIAAVCTLLEQVFDQFDAQKLQCEVLKTLVSAPCDATRSSDANVPGVLNAKLSEMLKQTTDENNTLRKELLVAKDELATHARTMRSVSGLLLSAVSAAKEHLQAKMSRRISKAG